MRESLLYILLTALYILLTAASLFVCADNVEMFTDNTGRHDIGHRTDPPLPNVLADTNTVEIT